MFYCFIKMSHHINFDADSSEIKRFSPKGNKNESKSAKKLETKKLEIDNKQMEWRLHQLKLAMEKEKEERGKKSYIWQSGKDGALESHARNILGKTVISKSGQKNKAKMTKVAVLTDEPLDIPKRTSHTKDLIEKLKKPTPPSRKPDVVRVESTNKESWITVGLDRLSDDVLDIQSDHDGNLPLSTIQGLSPSAIGLYFMRYGRKRLLLAIDNKIIQPKSGWGRETYYPYEANLSPQKSKIEPSPPPQTSARRSANRAFKKLKKSLENGYLNDSQHDNSVENIEQMALSQSEKGSLLIGTVDEEANAKAFHDAVLAWRNGSAAEKASPKRLHSSGSHHSAVKTSAHVVQSDPIKRSEITFSETSTLSFMEKILLKRHRETDVPPLPKSTYQSGDGISGCEELPLTAEEIEEHERIRQLFTPQPTGSISEVEMPLRDQVCSISEATADEALSYGDSHMIQSTNCCFVEEISDDDDEPRNDNISSTVDMVNTYIVDDNQITDFRVRGYDPTKSAKQSTCETTTELYNFIPKKSMEESFSDESQSLFQRRTGSSENKSNLVRAIGKMPLNPDAVYNTNLEEHYINTEQERLKLYSKLDQEPDALLMCGAGHVSSFAIPGYNEEEKFENEFDDNLTTVSDVDEVIEREEDDKATLEKLEWELASQAGNITSDGRISRLIDEWSSDENDTDLGIMNDPGMGSGLSTPDPDPIMLVGTSMSWQDDNTMIQEFQRMEDLLLVNENSFTGVRENNSQ